MKLKTRELTICAMFSALMIVGAFVKIDIPLPLYTMHFTLQWFFVIMAGLLLGEKTGALSVVVYLALGLAGLPVFAAGGGIAYVLRPGFGFLLGFVLAAYLIGLVVRLSKKQDYLTMLLASGIGLVAYYLVGAIYFYLIKNIYTGDHISFAVVVVTYCLITIVPDFILCIIACLACRRIKPIIGRILSE